MSCHCRPELVEAWKGQLSANLRGQLAQVEGEVPRLWAELFRAFVATTDAFVATTEGGSGRQNPEQPGLLELRESPPRACLLSRASVERVALLQMRSVRGNHQDVYRV